MPSTAHDAHGCSGDGGAITAVALMDNDDGRRDGGSKAMVDRVIGAGAMAEVGGLEEDELAL